jgi:hypothetical protein
VSKNASEYYSTHMVSYEPFECVGGAPIMSILPKAIGRQWDNIVLGALHAYNPTSIRVTNGGVKCDARHGRVTVYVDKNNVITAIHQEVYVSIPGDNDDETDANHTLVQELI